MSLVLVTRKAALVLAAAGLFANYSAAQEAAGNLHHSLIQVVTNEDGTARHSFFNTTVSANWSGYVLPNFSTSNSYTSASASWTVPAVTYQTIPRYSPAFELSS